MINLETIQKLHILTTLKFGGLFLSDITEKYKFSTIFTSKLKKFEAIFLDTPLLYLSIPAKNYVSKVRQTLLKYVGRKKERNSYIGITC